MFSQDARKSIAYYIMPRRTYPHGMLTSQVLQHPSTPLSTCWHDILLRMEWS